MPQLPNLLLTPQLGQVLTTPTNSGAPMWPILAIEAVQALIKIIDELVEQEAVTTLEQQAILEQQRKVLSDQINALGT